MGDHDPPSEGGDGFDPKSKDPSRWKKPEDIPSSGKHAKDDKDDKK